MRSFKLAFGSLIVLGILAVGLWLFVGYYHIIFARTVTGEVISVQKVDASVDVLATRPGEQIGTRLFSYAVAVEDQKTKEILVSSSEDRRWATLEKGNCVTARFFPYPPWRLDRAGAFFSAQVITFMKTCDKKEEPTTN